MGGNEVYDGINSSKTDITDTHCLFKSHNAEKHLRICIVMVLCTALWMVLYRNGTLYSFVDGAVS
jgi:hypothetical protein